MVTSHVIIGDGIAGAAAAETIRKKDPDAEVTVLTDEGEALYNRILTKEYAKGKLPEGPIHIHDETWYEERAIDLWLNVFVVDVDTEAGYVHTHDGDDIEYDRLLIATGGTPSQLPVRNSDASGIHHFWTFQDARGIREHAERAETGVVIGAGLLGIDLAAVCGEHGIDAHYLMRGECWWRYALSEQGAEIVHEGLRSKNVTPVFDCAADRFETDDGRVVATVDTNGDRYASEFVGVAIGLNYNTEFLQDTGVELEDGIVVDEHMETSVEDVYAAGDVTRFPDFVLGERTQNGSWGSAREQGAVAGANMVAESGDDVEEFRWVSSYSITHFDFPFLSFGHPTQGNDAVERTYAETEWRRVALKDGRVVGGVLIGDLTPQSKLKKLARERRDLTGRTELLLEEDIDMDRLDADPAPEAE